MRMTASRSTASSVARAAGAARTPRRRRAVARRMTGRFVMQSPSVMARREDANTHAAAPQTAARQTISIRPHLEQVGLMRGQRDEEAGPGEVFAGALVART